MQKPFVHIGGDITVRLSEVVAILDLQRVQHASASREYIEVAQSERRIGEIPEDTKSLVITAARIYTSPISSVTLARRAAEVYRAAAREVF